MVTKPKARAIYIHRPQLMALDHACSLLWGAFPDSGTYLVGSALARPDYRDVDVRTILRDDDFVRLFPTGAHLHTPWEFQCMVISHWLSEVSKLPVDYQIQSMTDANGNHSGLRNALGLLRWNRGTALAELAPMEAKWIPCPRCPYMVKPGTVCTKCGNYCQTDAQVSGL